MNWWDYLMIGALLYLLWRIHLYRSVVIHAGNMAQEAAKLLNEVQRFSNDVSAEIEQLQQRVEQLEKSQQYPGGLH